MATLSFELSDQHIAELKAMAVSRGTSVDDVVCELLGKWLDAYERGGKENANRDHHQARDAPAATDDRPLVGKATLPRGD